LNFVSRESISYDHISWNVYHINPVFPFPTVFTLGKFTPARSRCLLKLFFDVFFQLSTYVLMWRNWNAEIQLWLTQPVHLSLTFRFYSVGENRTCWCYAAGYQSVLFPYGKKKTQIMFFNIEISNYSTRCVGAIS
jgi:hypothetical protein